MAKHEAIYQEHGFETLPLFHSGRIVPSDVHVLVAANDDVLLACMDGLAVLCVSLSCRCPFDEHS
jgi:hypothetical protein